MTASYWQLDAGWRDRWVDTAIPRHVDYAIIGAGLAGLATAIRLRQQDPTADIIVLEAERVGHGASGRNAGFLSPLAAPVWLLGAQRSPEQAWGAARINTEVHAIARWLAEHVPECELEAAKLALQAHSRISDAAKAERDRVTWSSRWTRTRSIRTSSSADSPSMQTGSECVSANARAYAASRRFVQGARGSSSTAAARWKP
jgi:glycine/D-amino acid oxidase-like deaminating enzyme